MSCNNIKVTNNRNFPYNNNDVYYNHYSSAFQNTFNNKISSGQKRLNGTNHCTSFCPLIADNNNNVPQGTQFQKWSNQRDYGNICVQSYDPSNMIYSNCFPYNRIQPLSNPDNTPADPTMAWAQNVQQSQLDNLYYN